MHNRASPVVACKREESGGDTSRTAAADDANMSTPETARYLKCSARHLERLRLSGGGAPFCRIGGRVIYRRASVDAWLAENEVQSTSHATVAKSADKHKAKS